MDKNNAQQCLYMLCDELLGYDYYITTPMNRNQANKLIRDEIIRKYKRKSTFWERLKKLFKRG